MHDKDAIEEFARRVNQSQRIVVVAGAGISTDAGIPVSNSLRTSKMTMSS